MRGRYHAAEGGAQLVQTAGRREQQHFILQRPGKLIQNQLQNLPVGLLSDKQRAEPKQTPVKVC